MTAEAFTVTTRADSFPKAMLSASTTPGQTPQWVQLGTATAGRKRHGGAAFQNLRRQEALATTLAFWSAAPLCRFRAQRGKDRGEGETWQCPAAPLEALAGAFAFPIPRIGS